jgi:hypothetical protein
LVRANRKPTIRRGDLVEFTEAYHRDYPPPPTHPDQPQYGVALGDSEETHDGHLRVKVRLADLKERTVTNIWASGWHGWMPDSLEPVYERINNPEGADGEE